MSDAGNASFFVTRVLVSTMRFSPSNGRIDAAVGVLQVIGPSFSESFDVFLPSVMRYAKGSRPASDRAMAVGCLAEVFECIGG